MKKEKPNLSHHESLCCFKGILGQCNEPKLNNSDFCFWHDPTIDKSIIPNLGKKLEQRMHQDPCMEGFQLKGAQLDHINLSYHTYKQSCQLINANLKRAHLKHAHLYRINLKGSCLLKSNFSNSNLNHANMKDCNLLGIKLDHAKIEQVNWGSTVKQFNHKSFNNIQKKQLYLEAEEITRNLRKNCESQGLFQQAGDFFYQEMRAKHHQLPLFSLSRMISSINNIFSGYGEKPLRVILSSLLFIFICGFLYTCFGFINNDQIYAFSTSKNLIENLSYLLDGLYFSVVTFTTLGFGDIIPIGWSKLIVSLEAFIGSFFIALLVVVFTKKMTR